MDALQLAHAKRIGGMFAYFPGNVGIKANSPE
jgi:hypothetical protein